MEFSPESKMSVILEVEIFSVRSYRGLVADDVRYTVNDKEVREPLEYYVGLIVQVDTEFPEVMAGIEGGKGPPGLGTKIFSG